MATESPFISDGSQTTAAANLSTNQFCAVKIVGARSVNLASAGGEAIYGILQNKPTQGAAANVGIFGVMKALAGGTIAAGAILMTNTSAQLITATTGNNGVAQALEAAVAGQVFTVYVGLLGRGQ